MITNFKVSVTKHGDGLISYKSDRHSYRVLISKDDKVIIEIFNTYHKQLSEFKNRHYAIAKWIVRDIRAEGYVFRSYSNNFHNIRPVKQFSPLQNRVTNNWTIDKILRKRSRSEVTEFERLLH